MASSKSPMERKQRSRSRSPVRRAKSPSRVSRREEEWRALVAGGDDHNDGCFHCGDKLKPENDIGAGEGEFWLARRFTPVPHAVCRDCADKYDQICSVCDNGLKEVVPVDWPIDDSSKDRDEDVSEVDTDNYDIVCVDCGLLDQIREGKCIKIQPKPEAVKVVSEKKEGDGKEAKEAKQATRRKSEKLWWCQPCSLRRFVTKIDRGVSACRTPENDGYVEYQIYELRCKTCEHSIGEYSWPRWSTEQKDPKAAKEPQSPRFDPSQSPDYTPSSPAAPDKTPEWQAPELPRSFPSV